jgi:hypothetical protein
LLIVVLAVRPRTAPVKPMRFISLATWQRGATIASRRSCRQTLCTP